MWKTGLHRDLSQELLHTHLTLDLFILSSQLQEDFLSICSSSAEARGWCILEVLDIDLLMNEPKQTCPALCVLA